MSREQLTAVLRDPNLRDSFNDFAHPIVKLSEDELARVIGGFDDPGTSNSSLTSSTSTCDTTKKCCCSDET
jgi:hypothetical protein